MFLFLYSSASYNFILTLAQQQQQQQQQQQHYHQELPLPIKINNPINDGVYIRTVTLPSKHTDADADADESDAEGSTGSSNSNVDIREKLIMYDFKPAYPPYTTHSLEELLLIPKKDENVLHKNDNIENESEKEDIILSRDDDIIDGGLSPKYDGIEDSVNEDQIYKDGSHETTRTIDDNIKVKGDEEEVISTSNELEDELLDASTNMLSSIDDDNIEEINNNGDTQSEEQSDSPDIEGEKEEGDIAPIEVSANDNDNIDDDIPPRPAEKKTIANDGYDDTIYPDDYHSTQPLPTTLTSSTTATALDEVETFDESSTTNIEDKEVEKASDDDNKIMSDAQEAGEEVIVDEEEEDDDDDATSVTNNEKEEGVIPSEEEEAATEFDLEPGTVKDNIHTIDIADTIPDLSKITSEDEEDKHPAHEDSSDQFEPKVTIQYDTDSTTTAAKQAPSSSTEDNASIINNNNNNRDANRQFVDGLDEIDKLFESVEVPDELDVGADGSSMQDVLVGQGLKIIWKRAKSVTTGIKEKCLVLTTSAKNLLLPIQENWNNILARNDDVDENDEEWLDLTNMIKDSTRDDDGKMKSPEQDENGHTKSNNKEEEEKREGKKDFSLIQNNPKVQKIIKWSKRRFEQAKYFILSIFEPEDDDDEDDFGLGLDSLPTFGSSVDESFVTRSMKQKPEE